jgi:hypothetical protein
MDCSAQFARTVRSGRGYRRVTEGGDYRFEEARLAAVTKLFVIVVSAFST